LWYAEELGWVAVIESVYGRHGQCDTKHVLTAVIMLFASIVISTNQQSVPSFSHVNVDTSTSSQQ